jgi:hypothetical protein
MAGHPERSAVCPGRALGAADSQRSVGCPPQEGRGWKGEGNQLEQLTLPAPPGGEVGMFRMLSTRSGGVAGPKGDPRGKGR